MLVYDIGRSGERLTVWLCNGEIEQPKCCNSKGRSLHFGRRVGDLDVGFYGRERVTLLLSVPASGRQ